MFEDWRVKSMLLAILGGLVGILASVALFTDQVPYLRQYTVYMFMIAWVLTMVGYFTRS